MLTATPTAVRCSAWLGVRVLGFILLCKLNDLLCGRPVTERRQWLARENVVNCPENVNADKSLLPANDSQRAEIKVCGALCDEHLNQCKQLRLLSRLVGDAVKLLHVISNLQNARNVVALLAQRSGDSANRDVIIVPNSAPIFVMPKKLIKRIGECIHDVEKTKTMLDAAA